MPRRSASKGSPLFPDLAGAPKAPLLVSTARIRLVAGPHTEALDAMGVAWGRMERALHAELVAMARASGRVATAAEMNALKVRFMEIHQTISRHYNSVRFGLKGAHASRVACWTLELGTVEAKRDARVAKRDAWAKRLENHAKAEAGISERAAKGKAPTKAQCKALLSATDVAVGREAVFRHTRIAHRYLWQRGAVFLLGKRTDMLNRMR